jgi:Tol biopolymer transport system component
MKKIILLVFISSAFFLNGKGQASADTNFRVEIINFEWMPDNSHLVIHLMKFDKRRKIRPESKVFLLNIENGKMEWLLDKAGNPAPSPDGKLIAFDKNLPGNKSTIYLYDLGNKKEMPLSSDTANQYAPQWSPDGKAIVFDEIRNKLYHICIVDMASRSIRRIMENDPYSFFNPVWSPGGGRILYFLEKGDNHDQIYLTDPKVNVNTNLTHDTNSLNFYPSWITNDKIIFARSPGKLMLMDMQNNNLSLLGMYGGSWARFNPTIKKLAYVSLPPDSKLMILDWMDKTEKPVIRLSEIQSLF